MYLTPDSTRPFLAGSAGGAWTDEEAISFGRFGIRTLYLGIIDHGTRDGALGVIDDESLGCAAEVTQCVVMAFEPRRDRLVAHELDVLMTAKAQRHDEEPGLGQRPAARIEHQRSSSEVNLRRFARCEVEDHGRRRCAGP